MSLLAFLHGAPAVAGTIEVIWDEVTDPALTGYRLFYSTQSGTYTQWEDVGQVTNYTVTGLSDCVTYYLALKSLDDAGLESPTFSPELSGFTQPRISGLNPSAAPIGSSQSLVVDGSSFESGASLSFSEPGIAVSSVSVDSCNRIVVQINIAPDVPVGPVDVRVVNPGNVPAAVPGILNLTIDSPPADVSNLHRTDIAASP